MINTPSVFKANINAVFDQERQKQEKTLVMPRYLDEVTTDERWVTNIEKVGFGLYEETDEMQQINLDETHMKKFAKAVLIPEEWLDDVKAHKDVWDATRMLVDSAMLTKEYDGASLVNNITSSSYMGGDGVALASASHPLKGGGTASNYQSSLTPSESSIGTVLVACEKMVNSRGYITGIRGKRIFGPSNYKFTFKKLLMSPDAPDTSNRAINAIKGELESDYVSIPYLTTTTSWGVKTDVRHGMKWYNRRKLRIRETSHDRSEVKQWTASYRANRSWDDWRGVQWVPA